MRFICTGGGTGGHLYPIVALADYIRSARKDAEILFIGTSRGLEAKLIPRRGYPLSIIPARGLSPHPIKAALALSDLAAGTLESMGIIKTFMPDFIVGSGGYVSAPVVIAGRILGVPSLLLEQNALPGKTTKLLARWARKVAVSFEETARHLPQGKGVFTGNPVREEIRTASRADGRARLAIDGERFCILVTGASQGAKSINEAVVEALGAFADRELTVIHLTGEKNHGDVLARTAPIVEGKRIQYICLDYLEEIALAYAAADLVVCRAGATTLAEVTVRGLPAVMVPYPFAADDHQMKNARALEKAGASVVIEDGAVRDRLAPIVNELMESREKLSSMAKASRGMAQDDALERIVRLIEETFGYADNCGNNHRGAESTE